MRIGLMLGDLLGRKSVEQQVQEVVDAERDGFDVAWFGQVFGVDAMSVLAIAGTRTSRIPLGTAVVPIFSRHPFVMAQQASTVQAAAGGRFTLGVGLSHAPVVEGMWGLSYDRPAQRMKEYLSVIGPLLTEGRVGYQGELYRTNAGVDVEAGRPVPLLVAALAPRMLRLAGEMAEGTITWMAGPKTIATHIVPKLRIAAQEAGRRADPRVVVGLPVAVTDDEAAGREAAAKVFQVYGQLPNYRRMLDVESAPGPGAVAITGTESDVERQVRGLATAGATDLLAQIYPVGDDADASRSRTRDLLRSLVGKI